MLSIIKKRVLILCTGNSCRSQIAEGIAKHFYSNNYEIESAGVAPSFVHPHAITVMKEIRIDISHHRSKSIDEFQKKSFDFILTVCGNADQKCPIFPGKAKRIHWGFPDPAHATGSIPEILEQFRQVRDLILKKFKEDWEKTFI